MARRAEEPTLLFTDGAAETGKVSGGVVIFSVAFGDPRPRYLVLAPPEAIAQQWTEGGLKQAIAQAELFPQLVARLSYPEAFQNMLVLAFIDNDSVRFGLVAGSSPVLCSARLIGAVWAFDAVHGAEPWYDRIASPSNPSDAPSRGDRTRLLQDFPSALEGLPRWPAAWVSEKALGAASATPLAMCEAWAAPGATILR